jgi:hypothetical protein
VDACGHDVRVKTEERFNTHNTRGLSRGTFILGTVVEDAPCLSKSEAIGYKQQSFRVRTIFERRNDAGVYVPNISNLE